jgi:hypothetical protein
MKGCALVGRSFIRVARGCLPLIGLSLAGAPVKAQEVGPASVESRILARAASAERAGRVEEAKRELESVLDANPTSLAALPCCRNS